MATKQSPTPKLATKKHTARLERERQQVRLIQTVSITAIVIVILMIGYGILDTTYLQARKPVAEVNGEKITLSYWQERVQLSRMNLTNTLQQYQFYQQNFGMDTSQQQQQIQMLLQVPETLGQQVLTQLVDEAQIRQKAHELGITVTADEVETKIRETLGFSPNGTPTPTITPTEVNITYPTLTSKQLTLFPSTATPTQVLTSTPAATNTPDLSATATPAATSVAATPTFLPEAATATATPFTLDGYKAKYGKSLENIKALGVSEATFRSAYENVLYQQKLLAVLAKDAPHTQEKVWARHILVNDEKTANDLYAKLISGLDFAETAKKESKDTGSGANGGDLGWFGKGAMVPEFEQAAYSQKIGEIGKPVKSQFGYHIIQVIDRQELPATATEYEKNKQTIFDDWLKKANDDAKTAKKIITYDDVWKSNIPAMPASLTQAQPQ